MSDDIAQVTAALGSLVIDSTASLHGPTLDYWVAEEARHLRDSRAATLSTRLQRVERTLVQQSSERQGDAIVARVKDVFHHGMGIKWGEDQIRVFNAFLASCLPFIYGDTWAEEKTRVLREWGLTQQNMYSLINMARRNGKTFVTSGTAASLVLCVPSIKIAIFSTCKRTSQMLLEACMDMIEKTFERGTHVTRENYIVVSKNMESVCFECAGTKRIIGSFPVVVSGLPPTATEDALLPYFKQFGSVVHIRLKYNRETGACLGYGFVAYSNGKAAKAAAAAEKTSAFTVSFPAAVPQHK